MTSQAGHLQFETAEVPDTGHAALPHRATAVYTRAGIIVGPETDTDSA